MQIIGISYFTKIGALNSPAVQRGGRLRGSNKARRIAAERSRSARQSSEAAVDCRPCRHYSAARCSAAVVYCGGLRQNSRAEPASRARRTAAVERRVGNDGTLVEFNIYFMFKLLEINRNLQIWNLSFIRQVFVLQVAFEKCIKTLEKYYVAPSWNSNTFSIFVIF